jgi:hypothetical protein
VKVHFFLPEGGGMQPGESAGEFSARLVEEIRRTAPIDAAGRKKKRAKRTADAEPQTA